MKQAPIEIITVVVDGKPVVLDPGNMRYNENSLAEYMNVEYGWLDYFGKQLEHAQKEVALAEIDAEAQYALKFMESKDAGNTDNYAKAYATAHADVVAAKKKTADRKEVVGHIKAHISAWNKNHDNAQNRGHSLRAEMKALSRDFYDTDAKTCTAEEVFNQLEYQSENVEP